MEERLNIVVVDDDPDVRMVLSRYLTSEGFRIIEAANGAAMREIIEREPVDLILLDLGLPGEDGLSLARHIRRHASTPIIFVSGKDDVVERVAGLEAGGDVFMTKPFHLREILANIRAVMRRTHMAPSATEPAGGAQPSAGDDVLLFGDWRLDLQKRELHRGGVGIVDLTAAEFELLRAFAQAPNRVLNRDQLMDMVRGREWAVNDRAIDTQVGRLRKKIEANPANPSLIKTVRGVGYTFSASVTRR